MTHKLMRSILLVLVVCFGARLAAADRLKAVITVDPEVGKLLKVTKKNFVRVRGGSAWKLFKNFDVELKTQDNLDLRAALPEEDRPQVALLIVPGKKNMGISAISTFAFSASKDLADLKKIEVEEKAAGRKIVYPYYAEASVECRLVTRQADGRYDDYGPMLFAGVGTLEKPEAKDYRKATALALNNLGKLIEHRMQRALVKPLSWNWEAGDLFVDVPLVNTLSWNVSGRVRLPEGNYKPQGLERPFQLAPGEKTTLHFRLRRPAGQKEPPQLEWAPDKEAGRRVKRIIFDEFNMGPHEGE